MTRQNKWPTYLLHLSNWINLRKIAGSKVVQSSALFPFVGYFALINDYTKSFFDHSVVQLKFSVLTAEGKLFLLYFGLFIIGISVLLYNLRCPFLIKRFESEDSCADLYMKMADLGQVYAMLVGQFGVPSDSPNPTHRELGVRFEEFDRNPAVWQQFLSIHREEIFGFYVSWYNKEAHDRPVSRACCSAGFALGFLFISLPSLDTFAAVCRAL